MKKILKVLVTLFLIWPLAIIGFLCAFIYTSFISGIYMNRDFWKYLEEIKL